MSQTIEEIIDFGSTLDFQLRPNYVPQLRAEKADLACIFGKYLRPAAKADWIACGLNGCDQPHRFGFTIRLHDGRETHCGPDCGERDFDTRWDEVVATLKAAEQATATRNAVAALLSQRDALIARGVDVAERSRRLESRIQTANVALAPVAAMRKAIESCAKNGGSIRTAVKNQATGLAAGRRSQPALLRTLATIDGIELLTSSFTRYSAVIETMLPSLRSLSAEALDGSTQKDLQLHSKQGQSFTDTLDRAERQLRRGERLLGPSNLQKLELIVVNQLRSRDVTPQLRKALDGVYAA